MRVLDEHQAQPGPTTTIAFQIVRDTRGDAATQTIYRACAIAG